MKSLFLLILFAGITSASAQAQQYIIQDPQASTRKIPLVSGATFPIGAAVTDGSRLDSVQSMLANTYAFFNWATGTEDIDSLYGIHGGTPLAEYKTYREQRNYLFSGYRRADEHQYDYAVTNGSFAQKDVGAMGGLDNLEFLIPVNDTLLKISTDTTRARPGYKGTYLLRMPTNQIYGSSSTDVKHFATYFDFMYSFDRDLPAYDSLGLSDNLFFLDLWIHGAKPHASYNADSNWSKWDTVLTYAITKEIFEASAIHDSGAHSWSQNQNVELEHNLMTAPLSSGGNGRQYARYHIVLADTFMQNYYRDGTSDSATIHLLQSRYTSPPVDTSLRNVVVFDFRLRRNPAKPIPIFVKGLRMRNGGAEKLLTGQLDTLLLRKQFDTITQGPAYDDMINIHVEDEPYPDRYYIMGYLDRFALYNTDAAKQPLKRLTSFTPYHIKQSRLVWDDLLWSSARQDAAPDHFYRNIDYTSIFEARNIQAPWDTANKPFAMTALPIDALPKSIISSGAVIPSINMFTQRVWPRSTFNDFEIEHDAIFARSYRKGLQTVNEAAFSLGSKAIPFRIMGQAYIGFYKVLSGDTSWTDFKYEPKRPLWGQDSLRKYFIPIVKTMQLDTSYTDPVQIERIIFDGTAFFDTSALGYDRGHVTAEGIRLQANVAAAWGAKGYIYSNAGLDASNIGFNSWNFTYHPDSGRFRFEHDADVATEGVQFVSDRIELGITDDLLYEAHHVDTPGTIRYFADTANHPGYVFHTASCNSSMLFRTLPTAPNGPWFYNNCNTSFVIRMSLPTFYGFKTRYRGVKLAFADLHSSAEKLSQLTWTAAWDVSGRDTTIPTRYLDSLPISDISTVIQKKKRMGSESDVSYQDDTVTGGAKKLDDDDERFVEVGVMRDTNEVSTRYVYVVNRRVWPNKMVNDTSSNNQYLGNVAVRNIRFKVKPQMFGKDSNYIYWEVTDYKKPHQVTLFHRDSLYEVLLQPGEGRLFRIAPSISATLGEMSTNRYNNARHIAAIEGVDTVHNYAAIYEADGNIRVTYTYEAPANDPLKRSIDTQSEILIDSNVVANNETPAIAYHIARKKIGAIYVKRVPIPGPANLDDISILFSKAYIDSNKYVFSTPQLLSTFNAPKGYVASPSIAYAPAGGSFWVAWNDTSRGAVIRLLEIETDTILPHQVDLFKNDVSKVRFVSLATHDDVLDSVFVAFEEGTATNAHIYFASVGFYYDGVNDSMFIENPVTRISWGHGTCKNYNPQIQLSGDRKISVVWDAIGHSISVLGQPQQKPTPHYAMLRQRDSMGVWSKFTAFRVFYRPDGITNDSLRSYPNIAFSTKDNFPFMNESSTRWDDKVRITWNDPTTEMVGIARQGFTLFDPSVHWSMYDLLQPSLEPAMPVVSRMDSVVQPLMYRAPNRNSETGLFDARITHMDFPITNVKRITRPVAKITAGTTGFLCAPMISGVIETEVKFARKDSSDIDTNRIGDTPPWATQRFHDSVYNPITWNSQKIRSYNFMLYTHDTIRYDRFFHVGTFEEGDTANAKEELYDSSDYVKIRILLRSSYDHSILGVLDSCIITKLGYSQSTVSVLDTTRTYISPSAHVDSVYISFEADRGNAANDYEVFSTFVYDDYLVDAFPEDGPAFKQANANPTPSAHQSHSTPLLVTVNPNPFSGSTTITVETQKGLPFVIEVYDLLGKRLGTVYNGISEQEKGWFTLGKEMLTPGSYFVRVQAGSMVETRRIQLEK